MPTMITQIHLGWQSEREAGEVKRRSRVEKRSRIEIERKRRGGSEGKGGDR